MKGFAFDPYTYIGRILFTSLLVLGLSSTGISEESPSTESLIVRTAPGLSVADQQDVVLRNGGQIRSSIPQLNMYVVEVPAADAEVIALAYADDPQVASVEFDTARKVEWLPNDALIGSQWHLPQIGWDEVYLNATLNSDGYLSKVAILDTGISAAHSELADVVVPGMSVLAPGSDGMTDPHGHGTWLAGIVAAQTDNGEGIAGVAYEGVKLVPVQVIDAKGEGQDSDIIAGLIWAADNGADVVLMGFSNPGFSENLQAAIDYAWSKDVVLVAAVGNDALTEPTYPAGDAGVMGVSATDYDDGLAVFSSSGAAVFVAAPGVDITSTAAEQGYAAAEGTSASAAIVAGVAAFMRAVDPTLTNGAIVGRIARNADPAGSADPDEAQLLVGNGRINMPRALADTSTEEVKPAGAPGGGPFVGPYTISSTSVTMNPAPAVTAPGTVKGDASGSWTGMVPWKFSMTFAASTAAASYRVYLKNGGSEETLETSPACDDGGVTEGTYQGSLSVTLAGATTSPQTWDLKVDTLRCGGTGSSDAKTASSWVVVSPPAVITSAIHNTTHATVTSVTLGATVHDSVTASRPAGQSPVPTGNVTVDYFTNGACTGTPADTSAPMALGSPSGSSATVDVTSFTKTPAAAGNPAVSFRANYLGDSYYLPISGPCEPLTVTGTTHTITFNETGIPTSDTGATDVLAVTIGATTTSYDAGDFPVVLNVSSGTSVSYSYASPIGSSTSGKRYVLTGGPTPASPQTVNANTDVSGTYGTQFQLTLATNPAGVGVANLSGLAAGGWYDAGATATITAAQDVDIVAGASRYHFTAWSGASTDTTLTTNVTMDAAKTLTANYDTQYKVTFDQSGIGGDTGANTVVTVASADKAAGDLPFETWVKAGESISFDFKSPVGASAGKRYVLSNDPNAGSPLTVNAAQTITGTYGVQWKVTFAQTGIGGDTGTNTVVSINSTGYDVAGLPHDVWIDDNGSVSYAYSADVDTSPASGKRYHLNNGGSLPASPVTVTAAQTITGDYDTQYKVTFDQTGIGGDTGANTVVTVASADKAAGDLPFETWVKAGESISFDFKSPVGASAGKRYVLSNDPNAGSPLTVNAAQTITGTYVVQYLVTFEATGLGGDATPAANVVTGGDVVTAITVVDLGTAAATRWFDSGNNLSAYAYAATVTSTTVGKTYVKTNGPTPASIVGLSSPTTVTAEYKAQVTVALTITPNTVQYSDAVDLSATITPDTAGSVQFRKSVNGGGSYADVGLPVTVVSGTATLDDQVIGEAAGTSVRFKAVFLPEDTDNFVSSEDWKPLTVTREDATFSSVDIQNSGSIPISLTSFTVEVGVKELRIGGVEPDVGGGANPGDIGKVTAITAKIDGITTNASYTGSCGAGSGGGSPSYASTRNFTCTFASGGAFTVDAYTLSLDIPAGNTYYRADTWEEGLAVFDPANGFATGGGTFTWGGDRVSFGFSATLTKGKSAARGGIVAIRHFEGGGKCRLKSNQMNPSVDSNHVTMTGSGNYVCNDAAGNTTASKGNVNITAYGEDWGTSGADQDKFWVTNNASGAFTNMLQMPSTPAANAVLLTGGNIQVPQPQKK